ncbi:MAG: uroporphyrinogen-III synthase, partial [Proteobacteria bacterium]|nr:uroporphyrinogen-III synthase [Pseudomonadota bacterium]
HAMQIKPDFKVSEKTKVLAIGPAVKNYWKKHFETEIFLPSKSNSESIIELLSTLLPVDRVSILTAAGGRNLIKKYCISRQISFSQINTYQRKPLPLDENRLLDFIKLNGEIFLTASSCQIIDHLQQNLSKPTWRQLIQSKLVCGSVRIAKYAKSQGFNQALVANSPANKDMIQAIRENP